MILDQKRYYKNFFSFWRRFVSSPLVFGPVLLIAMGLIVSLVLYVLVTGFGFLSQHSIANLAYIWGAGVVMSALSAILCSIIIHWRAWNTIITLKDYEVCISRLKNNHKSQQICCYLYRDVSRIILNSSKLLMLRVKKADMLGESSILIRFVNRDCMEEFLERMINYHSPLQDQIFKSYLLSGITKIDYSRS